MTDETFTEGQVQAAWVEAREAVEKAYRMTQRLAPGGMYEATALTIGSQLSSIYPLVSRADKIIVPYVEGGK
jgi:hypothetical protein